MLTFHFLGDVQKFHKKQSIEIQAHTHKKSSLAYGRGEAKMAVHAKNSESPLGRIYLKGSKTNGGRLELYFEKKGREKEKKKRGSETRRELATCGALFFFCFSNFFFSRFEEKITAIFENISLVVK